MTGRLIKQTETYLQNSDGNQLCSEIKAFVRSYLMLREIEKRSIREYPEPLKHDQVNSTLRKIVLESSSSAQSEVKRYSGGARERANENLEKGELSSTDQRVLDGKACSWCGSDLPLISLSSEVKSTYCSHSCAEEGRLRRGGKFVEELNYSYFIPNTCLLFC